MIDEEGTLKDIHYRDRIFFDSVNGVAGTIYPVGTAGLPSNTIADVILMCAARNLKVIDVFGALALGAAMENYTFIGHRHENPAAMFDLNSQDVDDSLIEKCIVTGTQGGTGFLTLQDCLIYQITNFQGIANLCNIYDSMSLLNAGFADLSKCNSVHSDLTITVNAPTRASFKECSGNCTFTGQTGGVLYVRGYKGTLVIDAMTLGTCSIYANGADITINNTCNGGTINIYGNARVTDNSAAGCTVNDYTISTELDTVFREQADTAVNITAIAGGETDVFDLNAAATRYIVRNLRLKCADPGANTVTVRLRELVNDVSTIVSSFDITTANFGTYYTLMDMFGIPHLAGDDLQVTVQASGGGPYVVVGQYSHAISI